MLYFLTDILSGAAVPLLAVVLVFGAVKKAGAGKTALLALFTVYLAAVFDVVGIPYVQTLAWNPVVNWIPFSDLAKEYFSFWAIFQFAANIALFVPMGVLLPVIWRRFRSFGATVAAGALLSLCIELAQLFCARVTAPDDLLMNTLGAALGYGVAAAFGKRRWKSAPAAPAGHDCAQLLAVTAAALLSTVLLKYAIGSLLYSLPLFR